MVAAQVASRAGPQLIAGWQSEQGQGWMQAQRLVDRDTDTAQFQQYENPVAFE